MVSQNSFNTRSSLTVGGQRFSYFSLPALEKAGFSGLARLPYSLKILLENLLRHPKLRAAIESLAGRITVDDMRRMNKAVDADRRDPADVAREFLAQLERKRQSKG